MISQFALSLVDRLLSRTWNHVRGLPKKRVRQGVTLGCAVLDGRVSKSKVLLPHAKRAEHISLIGKTGTGKSFLLRSLIKQDIEAGNGVILFDVHGDLTPYVLSVAAALERKTKEDLSKRLIVIDPADHEYSCGLNLLEAKGEHDIFPLISGFTSILQHYWGKQFGPRTTEALFAFLYLASESGMTLLEIPVLMTNPAFRAKCLKQVRNAEVRAYIRDRYDRASEAMQQAIAGPVLNKITGFTVDPRFRHLIGQTASTFSLQDVLERNQVLSINLAKGRLGEQALTFGSLLFAKLKSAVFARKSRSLTSLYLDEVQNLVAWDSSLEVLLAECRKFNVCLVTSNQFQEQLPQVVRAALDAIGTHIYFQLSAPDAQQVSKHESAGAALAEKLRDLPHQQFLLKAGGDRLRHIRSLQLNLPSPDHVDLYARCQRRWMRKRTEIEQEIADRQPTQKIFAEAINDWE